SPGLSSFTQQPSSITVTEGSVARFTCTITATPPPIITWEFNRVTLQSATERITVLSNGVLQIQGVEVLDAGRYRCVVTNIAGRRRSIEATLAVNTAALPIAPQRPRIIAGPQNVTVPVHGSVVLECLATGNPRPLISWSRADHKSIDVHKTKVLGTGNLLISEVKLQHAGVYFCRATTPGTRNYTITAANITVLAPPSLVEVPESVTRPRAGTARFVCSAEGFPTPHVTWMKNGETIHSNGRVKMYNSKLVINQIIPEDDGIYQCQAENQLGSILATARLIVVMSDNRPSAPRNVRADPVSSSGILLAWERPLYNAQKVIAYSVHYMKAEGLNNEEYQIVIGNDTTRYIIDDLEAGRNYTFYIVAYMPMGASRMSDHVIQHTLEDVPQRAPDLILTSLSPSSLQLSWQPLSQKQSRGQVLSYRVSYRSGTEGTLTQREVSGDQTHLLLERLQPDATYLIRISAATKAGWGEESSWSSHRMPKDSSASVPLAPELQLESLNCTTVALRWQISSGDGSRLQGFKLSYHESGQSEGAAIQIPPHHRQHIIGGLDPRKKYHVKLLGYSLMGEGYQAEQTISTPGCSNSSSTVLLHWAPPAFAHSHALSRMVNYTVRCNRVGLQNASLVLYLQTEAQSLLVSNLTPNTNYEFAVRLHVDQLSSPWSPVVYQTTLSEAPTQAPVGVKVTSIEGGSALVSWKPPDESGVMVAKYTVLYASRRAWAAGDWQMLEREGTVTMALLENLQVGQVYLVKVSASNQMGDGPFSPAVELSRSMTGIIVGVCIALICIIICIFILACRSKSRKSCSTKPTRDAIEQTPPTSVRLANENQAESVEVMMPMMRDHFVDAKGGTNLIINSYGPVSATGKKKRRTRWDFFKRDSKEVMKVSTPSFSYHHGATLLCYTEASPQCSYEPPGGRSETSHSSEGSHETSDSGRYSHDETEPNNETGRYYLEESESGDETHENSPGSKLNTTNSQRETEEEQVSKDIEAAETTRHTDSAR
ncbi:hypothetical protein DNTS_033337, partial [Danionella cerebrum]